MIGRLDVWAFLRGMRRCTRRRSLDASSELPNGPEKTISVCVDGDWLNDIAPRDLGLLWALVVAQAELEGASSVRLHYGNTKMFYTIAGTAYEMVSVPSPAMADLVRLIVKASRTRWGAPGRMSVPFSDGQLSLTVKRDEGDDPHIEITGFSGQRRLPPLPTPGASATTATADRRD